MTVAQQKTDAPLIWALKWVVPWYVCVGLFAHMFLIRDVLLGPFDKGVVDNLGIVAVGIAIVLGVIWAGRNWRSLRSSRMALMCLGASIVVALGGLDSVDPAFPAKRVHVMEYFALAVVVFAAFKNTAHLGVRALAALILTAMLGGLDELLQGAMAERTYGLADILTNTYGALSGVLAICAVQFLKARTTNAGAGAERLSWAELSAPLALAVGYFLFLAALYPFRGLDFPLWALLPLAGGVVVVAQSHTIQALNMDIARFCAAAGIIAVTAMGGVIYVQIMAVHFI